MRGGNLHSRQGWHRRVWEVLPVAPPRERRTRSTEAGGRPRRRQQRRWDGKARRGAGAVMGAVLRRWRIAMPATMRGWPIRNPQRAAFALLSINRTKATSSHMAAACTWPCHSAIAPTPSHNTVSIARDSYRTCPISHQRALLCTGTEGLALSENPAARTAGEPSPPFAAPPCGVDQCFA